MHVTQLRFENKLFSIYFEIVELNKASVTIKSMSYRNLCDMGV